MDELLKDYSNYICFTFYENEQSCVITIYNSENVLWQKIVSEEEGRKHLVTYCLFRKYSTLEPHLDTVVLVSSDNARGYVRYVKSQNTINDLKYDLLPSFLCEFLETLQEQYKKVKIDYKNQRYYYDLKIEIARINSEKRDFLFTFQVNVKRDFSDTISHYMKKHESMNIQGKEENSNYIVLDGMEIPIEPLNKEQREYFMSKIRENDIASFEQFLASPLGQKLNQSLEEQDCIQLARIKPNMPE